MTGLLCIVMVMVMVMVIIIIMSEMMIIAVRLMALGNSISSQVHTATIVWTLMQQRRAAALLFLKRRHRQYTACPAARWLMTKL